MPRRQKEDATWWRVLAGSGGWTTVEHHGARGLERVLLRVSPDKSGRYRIHELHLLDTGEPVSAARLRAIRIAALEAILNLPIERAAIAERFEHRPDLNFAAAMLDFVDTNPMVVRIGRATETDLAQPLTSVGGKVHEETGTTPLRPVDSSGDRSALEPPSRGYSDEFYERVAVEYNNATRRGGGKPVAAIASAADVPRSTAARWVKEARRRKKLGRAPGRGKYGVAP